MYWVAVNLPAGVSMPTVPVDSGSQPAPGRHTRGECGWRSPLVCELNQATRTSACEPGPAGTPEKYTRSSSRSARSWASTSGSIGISLDWFQRPICRGNALKSGVAGTRSA